MKKFLILLLLCFITFPLFAVWDDSYLDDFQITAYGEGHTYEEAREAAIYNLGSTLYDPFIIEDETFQKIIRIAGNLETEYINYYRESRIHFEGTLFGIRESTEKIPGGYRVTVWIGSHNGDSAIYNTYFLSYNFYGIHDLIECWRKGFRTYTKADYKNVLEEEKLCLFNYRSALTVAYKLNPNFDFMNSSPNLYETYQRMLELYIEDCIEYKNILEGDKI